jgi:hypothetical protein
MFVNMCQASWRVRSDPELLPDGKAALSHGRVRPALRGGAGVLGAGHQPGTPQLFPTRQAFKLPTVQTKRAHKLSHCSHKTGT